MKKSIILGISFCVSLLTLVANNSVNLQICSALDYSCRTGWDTLEKSTYFFPIIFLFSLITYFAPERVFTAWFRFAKVAIPIIFLLSLAINLELHHDPQGELQDMFDVPALVLLYSIFTFGSTWQIYKAWK